MPDVSHVTDAEFRSAVIESEEPVLVDFWAPWCPPCRALAPVLEQLSAETGIKVVKVNTDEQQEYAAQLGVMSLPTLVRFDGGAETRRVVGAYPKAKLAAELGLAARPSAAA